MAIALIKPCVSVSDTMTQGTRVSLLPNKESQCRRVHETSSGQICPSGSCASNLHLLSRPSLMGDSRLHAWNASRSLVGSSHRKSQRKHSRRQSRTRQRRRRGEERLHFSLTANRTPIYGRAQASLPSPDANIQQSFPLSFASFKTLTQRSMFQQS